MSDQLQRSAQLDRTDFLLTVVLLHLRYCWTNIMS